MSLRLQALHDDVLLPLSNQPVILGRSRELRISSTSVSRHACSCFADGMAAAKIVASKRVYVMRMEGKAVSQVDKDGTCQVHMSSSACYSRLYRSV
jgi:hypothetical protein